MLYTLIADSKNYLGASIDSSYVEKIVGSLRGDRRDDRIDVNHLPRSWAGVFPDPLPIKFTPFDNCSGKNIPDIDEFQGRLFLSEKAFNALHELIKNDGEFVPAIYEFGTAYVFTPLRVAEADMRITLKNEWDEIVNLGFDEEQVKNWSLFRTEYNAYMRLYCSDSVKNAIEEASLSGLFITTDLANIFPEDRGDISELNG